MVSQHIEPETDEQEVGLAVFPAGQVVSLPGPRLSLPTMQELESLKTYGELVVASGLAPKHIDKWETAVVVMRYGHQLGVDEFTALQNMLVIDGKPSMNASLMHSLIMRDHGPDAVLVLESTETICQLVCRRRGSKVSSTVEYTIQEAEKAGLVNKPGPRGGPGVWKAYPKDMLFARAISRAGRQVFRDTTMGLYTPEELGGNVIDVHGEIVDVEAREQTAHIRELRDEHEAEKATAVAHDNTAKATKEQLQNILDLGHALGMSDEKVAEYCGKPGKDLTAAEAEQIRKELNDDLEKRIKADEERAAAAAQK